MASITLDFTANAATIKIPGYAGSDGQKEFTNVTGHPDPIVRAVANEYAANTTASGTITITAV